MVGSFFERAMPHSTGIIKSESSVCTKYLAGERNGREERKRERERERKREGWGEGRENASIRGHTVYTSLIHISEDGQLSCIQNSNTCSNRVAKLQYRTTGTIFHIPSTSLFEYCIFICLLVLCNSMFCNSSRVVFPDTKIVFDVVQGNTLTLEFETVNLFFVIFVKLLISVQICDKITEINTREILNFYSNISLRYFRNYGSLPGRYNIYGTIGEFVQEGIYFTQCTLQCRTGFKSWFIQLFTTSLFSLHPLYCLILHCVIGI